MARLRKEPGLCCTEKSDGLSLLFFTAVHAVFAVWRAGFPRATARPVSMALPGVQDAIYWRQRYPGGQSSKTQDGASTGGGQAGSRELPSALHLEAR